MNNYFNFNIPVFNDKYGSDWGSFKSIVESEVDHLFKKTFQLYHLKNPTYASNRMLEILLGLKEIPFSGSDPISRKRFLLRKFSTSFKDKGLESFYLDFQEEIVGERGIVYFGSDLGKIRWNYSRWEGSAGTLDSRMRWGTFESAFSVYIDCKTEDDELLDSIVEMYRRDYIRPAFYKIYLVNSSFAVLREV